MDYNKQLKKKTSVLTSWKLEFKGISVYTFCTVIPATLAHFCIDHCWIFVFPRFYLHMKLGRFIYINVYESYEMFGWKMKLHFISPIFCLLYLVESCILQFKYCMSAANIASFLIPILFQKSWCRFVKYGQFVGLKFQSIFKVVSVISISLKHL